MRIDPQTFWTPWAWLPNESGGAWHPNVLLSVDANGHWLAITPGVTPIPPTAITLSGPALPGLVNAHSHAFQRAFAGLAERREGDTDDFWSWRDRMYSVAQRITPALLRAIATQLYSELLHGGYTQICEFHYLQNAPDGKPYSDPLALTWALVDAATDAGVGLTMLPVLYERAGFSQASLREDQHRFASTLASVQSAQQTIERSGQPLLSAGIAIHSLRAATATSIFELRNLTQGMAGPLHIHVAEQIAEVDACLITTGSRPIEWLAKKGLLDPRWQLVHATHSTRAEIDAVARSGAGVVICPSTEANLGDGLCDLSGWLAAGVPLALGSDSHVTRSWTEELRWLEYGQRLLQQRRNVSADPTRGQASSAHHLWSRMQIGSAAAAGFARWGLVAGARADLLVIDNQDPCLLGIPPMQTLDALVFSSPARGFRDVMVAGQWVLREHQLMNAKPIAQQFESAMQTLWSSDPAPARTAGSQI